MKVSPRVLRLIQTANLLVAVFCLVRQKYLHIYSEVTPVDLLSDLPILVCR